MIMAVKERLSNEPAMPRSNFFNSRESPIQRPRGVNVTLVAGDAFARLSSSRYCIAADPSLMKINMQTYKYD